MGISHPEIDGSVSVLAVPHIGSQHRKSALRGLPPAFDFYQCVHGEGVPQRVWCRPVEIDMADDLSSLNKADLFEGLMKVVSDLIPF